MKAEGILVAFLSLVGTQPPSQISLPMDPSLRNIKYSGNVVELAEIKAMQNPLGIIKEAQKKWNLVIYIG